MLSIWIMLFSNLMIGPYFPVSAQPGNPPVKKPIHLWNFNVEEIDDDDYFGYQAKSDVYEAKFPAELDDISAEITISQNDQLLKMSLVNLECFNFTGQEDDMYLFENSSKVEPTLNGTKITYPEVYTNISLMYEINFHQ